MKNLVRISRDERRSFVLAFYAILVFLPVLLSPVRAENYLQVGGIVEGFHYKEFNVAKKMLNREDGNIPGVHVDFSKEWEMFSSILKASYVSGEVKYDGRTQGGVLLETDTKEKIIDLSAIISWSDVTKLNSPRLLAGLGYRRWVRDIQATTTTNRLYEKYFWKYWLLGLGFDVWDRKKWKISIEGQILRPINPKIYVDVSGYDSLTLGLRYRNGLSFSVPFVYKFSSSESLSIAGYYKLWELLRSDEKRLAINGAPTIYSISEPDSTTEVYGIQLLYRFSY